MCLLVAMVILSFTGITQNLVPNHSFEQSIGCTGPAYTFMWDSIPHWFMSWGSPDIMMDCHNAGAPSNAIGYQQAQDGVNYAALLALTGGTNGREMLSVRLSSPMVAGNTYCVSFYASMADLFTLSINRMGAIFTEDSLQSSQFMTYLNNAPDIDYSGPMLSDTSIWYKIEGTYIAQGEESFLYIGNFYKDNATDTMAIQTGSFDWTMYYIDNISVYDCTNLSTQNMTADAPEVYYDPFSKTLEIEFTPDSENYTLHVYDMSGRLIYSSDRLEDNSSINLTRCGKGMYGYTLVQTNSLVKGGKFVIQ